MSNGACKLRPRVRAGLVFEFYCENCKHWVDFINPRECPHRHGGGRAYNAMADGIVENIKELELQLGNTVDLTDARLRRSVLHPGMHHANVT